jgi:VIT1/CCC1 family predicted Fe2+/Mn2+ transporter
MNDQKRTSITVRRLDAQAEEMSNRELLGRILTESTELVRREVELAKAELMADLGAEARVARSVGVGAVLGLVGLNLLVIGGVLALVPLLSGTLPPWAVSLILGGIILAVAGIVAAVGWRRRVREPLRRTRKHLQEDVSFMKERLA